MIFNSNDLEVAPSHTLVLTPFKICPSVEILPEKQSFVYASAPRHENLIKNAGLILTNPGVFYFKP
jgi:hypothetical protein